MGSQYPPVEPPVGSRFRNATMRFGFPISPLYVRDQSKVLMKEAGRDDPLPFRTDVYLKLVRSCGDVVEERVEADYTIVNTAPIDQLRDEAMIIIFFWAGRTVCAPGGGRDKEGEGGVC
jgi:hypothetical protein